MCYLCLILEGNYKLSFSALLNFLCQTESDSSILSDYYGNLEYIFGVVNVRKTCVATLCQETVKFLD